MIPTDAMPDPAVLSPAAKRMRRHRQRRRDGLRCLLVELHETEIDALIRRELLKYESRSDPDADHVSGDGAERNIA